MTAPSRSREIALEQAVQIVCRFGDSLTASPAECVIAHAERFLVFLDPPLEAHAQADAIREAA